MSQVHQAPNLAQPARTGCAQAARAWSCRGQPSAVSQAPAGRVAGAVAVLQYNLAYLPHLVTIHLCIAIQNLANYTLLLQYNWAVAHFSPNTIFFFRFSLYIYIYIYIYIYTYFYYYYSHFPEYSNKFIKIYFIQFSSILQPVKP